MTKRPAHSSAILAVFCMLVLGACSSAPKVTATTKADAGDAPYDKILVILLASSFDSRRYLEKEIVEALGDVGTQAVASTTMMDSRTPVERETFLEMVDRIDADAVLVSQLANIDIKASKKTARPEATYNFRPTYYYNVWEVDLQEYVEPPSMKYDFTLVLATQMYSVQSRDVVWAIEAKSKFDRDFDHLRDYSIYEDEAAAIVKRLSGDGMIQR